MSANDRLERKALVVSIIGNLVMAGLGIGFSLLVRSGAILLDGLFSGRARHTAGGDTVPTTRRQAFSFRLRDIEVLRHLVDSISAEKVVGPAGLEPATYGL